jgi:hypothetical protein
VCSIRSRLAGWLAGLGWRRAKTIDYSKEGLKFIKNTNESRWEGLKSIKNTYESKWEG